MSSSKHTDHNPSETRIVYLNEGGQETIHLRRCRIVRTDSEGNRSVQLFDQPVVRIGAMAENDMVVSDDTVSRYHCEIFQDEDHYMLKDLDSTNGTFIDGVRIKEAFLASGSKIKLGETELNFEAVDEQIRVEPASTNHYGSIVGQSVRMRQIFHVLDRIASSAVTVVIEGETGTGKEVVARTIHAKSKRNEGPFIVFDCGAVPENLIESELFGHEKGAFTGANRARKGLFEMAHGGTLFLDEMGELSLDLQPKLLRVLESRMVRPVGANRSTPVDVRVIAATNRNLADEVSSGRFREDLFYRLSVVRISLPTLRERIDDIPLLVDHLLKKEQANRLPDGHRRINDISAPALRALESYHWPGNVRELANVLERACSFAPASIIQVDDLPEHLWTQSVGQASPVSAVGAGESESGESALNEGMPSSLGKMAFKSAKESWLATFEKDYIRNLLEKNGFNISSAAREAEIDRKYFRKLMKKYNIESK